MPLPNSHYLPSENVLVFIDSIDVSGLTKQKSREFFNDLLAIDPLRITKFELSFKAREDILLAEGLRLLNLDCKAYSYASEKSYLERLLNYKRIVDGKINTPRKKQLFSSLASISSTPLDLYFGADIFENKYLFAFWVIFGGAQRDGRIKYVKNANSVLKILFDSLGITSKFDEKKDIINIGFDIDDVELFYKIYYFLNKTNYHLISKIDKQRVANVIQFLGQRQKYWFFVSERYKTGQGDEINRKKIYLEFLGGLDTKEDITYQIVGRLFEIVGCPYNIRRLKEILAPLTAKIVILAFEENGTTTFYVRI